MALTASRRPTASTRPAARVLPAGYLKQAGLPLASLAVLLPLIVLYEIGTRYVAFDPTQHTEQRIVAFTLMQRFFELFGASGRYLPAMAVVGILLAWHIARNDPWKVRLSTVGGMLVEGVAWAIPLLALGTLTARYFSQYLPLAAHHNSGSLLVLSIGAGIYEELVFRFCGLTLLHLLLVDFLAIDKFWSYLYMVLISAIAFALYHYLGQEQFAWRSFIFRSVAGVYFAALFVTRGFGITALSHASYDIIVVLLRF